MRRRWLASISACAFLACHVIACACRVPAAPVPVPKKAAAPAEPHGCCAKKKGAPPAPEPAKKAPASKSCCCSDGLHLAIADEGPVQGAESEAFAPVSDAAAGGPRADRAIAASGRAPPGGAAVPLYTLHATLRI